MPPLDLTPFGFTPTETVAYRALLERGPSSGYALAKALAIARANAYQALNGLLAKGAATSDGGSPKIYRALSPSALVALLAGRQARELDELEEALVASGGAAEPATVPFEGERAFRELTLRTAARAAGAVSCVAPLEVLAGSLPVWRKRRADGTQTSLWCVCEEAADFPLPLAGRVPIQRVHDYFGGAAALVVTPDSGLIAHLSHGRLSGYWSSEPALVGAFRAALAALTID